MSARLTKTDIKDAIERCRAILPPGSRVYTMLASRSADGMTRRVRVFIATLGTDGAPRIAEITHVVAQALGMFPNSRGKWGVVVKGCGVEADFEVVRNLSYTLYRHNDVNIVPEDKGRPVEPRPDGYRAGYPLRYEKLGDGLR